MSAANYPVAADAVVHGSAPGLMCGTLTTEHSASSYGLPVFVCEGTAYGPAECGEVSISDVSVWHTERYDAIVADLKRAGYIVRA